MNKKLVFVILAAIALVLSACFSPWKGDEGIISIRIGGEAAGRTVDGAAFNLEEADIHRLVHTITLNNGPGPDQIQENIKYGGTVNFSVTPGRWTITIKAYLGKELYAEGSKSVDIKPGPNGAISITMTLLLDKPANSTPVADDFVVSGLSHIFDGSSKTVTITPKHDKSTGTITIYYDEETTAPSAIGTYAVTFDVAAVSGWNAATGLSAGTMVITKQTANPGNPAAGDFDIGNLTQTVGDVTAVTIEPKAGKSGGSITIYYNESRILPTAAGTYTVTFDVDEAEGWYAAKGLSAGILTITAGTISPITLDSIDVTTLPTKTQYNLNEKLNTAGMVVTATYSDHSTAEVTGYTTSDLDSSTAGNKAITVTYQGKTTTFTVNVIDSTKETVAMPTASPAGGSFVAAGTTVTLHTATVGAEIWYTINGSTPAKDGTGSFKYTDSFAITPPVTVKATAFKYGMNDSAMLEAEYPATHITVADISIIAPSNGAAPATEVFSLEPERFTAGTVTWEPADNLFKGSTVYTATVTLTAKSGYTFTGLIDANAKVNGDSAVVKENTGETLTLSRTFPATGKKAVAGIAIKSQPNKLTYNHGDNIDLSGLMVTLTYDDTTTEDVAAANFAGKGITTDPGHDIPLERFTYNNHPVKITAGGKTVNTNNLTVGAVPVSLLTFTPVSSLEQTYTGSVIEPAFVVTYAVTDSTRTLILGTDYTVTYTNNTNVGTAAATITCTGDYSGAKTINFTIKNITYTVAQIGGVAGVSTTTGLTFTFNGPVDSLSISAGDITIGGAAANYSAAFSGSGASWTLSLVTVNSTGNATVSINKSGVESQSKTVQVFAVGTGAIDITFEQIKGDEPLGDKKEITVTSASPTITVIGSYSSYNWYINGITGKGSSFTLKHADYTLGEDYYLTVEVVTQDGKHYSQTITVKIR